MKGVLFLFDFYLPYASANGICAEKVMRTLASRGIPTWGVAWGDGAPIETPEGDGSKRTIYTIDRRELDTETNRLRYYRRWLCSTRMPAMVRPSTAKAMLDTAAAVIEAKGIDTVICLSFPVESLVVGAALKARYPHIKTVAYLLDALAGGIYPRFLPRTFCDRRCQQWEGHLLASFDRIVCMKSNQAYHEQHSRGSAWYKKAVFLDVPGLMPGREMSAAPASSDAITIFFAGTLMDGERTPNAFFKVLHQITDQDIHVILAGKNRCTASSVWEDTPHVRHTFLGEIPYEAAQEYMYKADFLLNLGNRNCHLLPSKILEYMATGKPIISTYREQGDSSLPYLSKYPAIFTLSETEANPTTATALSAFLREYRGKQVPFSLVKEALYANTPDAFCDMLATMEADTL